MKRAFQISELMKGIHCDNIRERGVGRGPLHSTEATVGAPPHLRRRSSESVAEPPAGAAAATRLIRPRRAARALMTALGEPQAEPRPPAAPRRCRRLIPSRRRRPPGRRGLPDSMSLLNPRRDSVTPSPGDSRLILISLAAPFRSRPLPSRALLVSEAMSCRPRASRLGA